MGPIFNEKMAEKWKLWVREQCTGALFTMEKSTFVATIHEQCMNSSRITPWNAWKKKKNAETVTYKTCNPNGLLESFNNLITKHLNQVLI